MNTKFTARAISHSQGHFKCSPDFNTFDEAFKCAMQYHESKEWTDVTICFHFESGFNSPISFYDFCKPAHYTK